MQAGRSETGGKFGECQHLVEVEQNTGWNRGTEVGGVAWRQSWRLYLARESGFT